jgi:predicted nucleic acid-binding protein
MRKVFVDTNILVYYNRENQPGDDLIEIRPDGSKSHGNLRV